MIMRHWESGRGLILPCLTMPLLALINFSLSQWRGVIVITLLLTLMMLFHQRLRHFLLLPSCVVLTGVLKMISLNLISV